MRIGMKIAFVGAEDAGFGRPFHGALRGDMARSETVIVK
jgi:hypothetical protein